MVIEESPTMLDEIDFTEARILLHRLPFACAASILSPSLQSLQKHPPPHPTPIHPHITQPQTTTTGHDHAPSLHLTNPATQNTTKQGMNFDNGYVNAGFVTDTGRNCAELERPYVLVTNHAITNIRVRVYMCTLKK